MEIHTQLKQRSYGKMEENGPIDLLGFTPEEDAKNYALVEEPVTA